MFQADGPPRDFPARQGNRTERQVASVNFQECYELIPRLLEKNYPGRWHRDEIGDMPFWELNHHRAAVSTVSLVENGDNSVIKIATGLVMGIPPHPEIVEHVNGLNV